MLEIIHTTVKAAFLASVRASIFFSNIAKRCLEADYEKYLSSVDPQGW